MTFPSSPPRTSTVFRAGNAFTVSRRVVGANEAAALPAACVKCGAASTGTLSKTFYWHKPWVYVFLLLGVLPYAFLALILRQRIDLQIPLCADHRRRRRNLIIAAWLVAVAGIAVPVVFGPESSDSALPIVVAFLAILAAIVVGFVIARPLVPAEVDGGGATFKGAGEGFLRLLQ